MLYILTSTQTLVKIVIFIVFGAKKLKKRNKVTNLVQNLAKNRFKFAENDYFDQCLGWATPKRWSKFKTNGFTEKDMKIELILKLCYMIMIEHLWSLE